MNEKMLAAFEGQKPTKITVTHNKKPKIVGFRGGSIYIYSYI